MSELMEHRLASSFPAVNVEMVNAATGSAATCGDQGAPRMKVEPMPVRLACEEVLPWQVQLLKSHLLHSPVLAKAPAAASNMHL
jgi:hypothetical protein